MKVLTRWYLSYVSTYHSESWQELVQGLCRHIQLFIIIAYLTFAQSVLSKKLFLCNWSCDLTSSLRSETPTVPRQMRGTSTLSSIDSAHTWIFAKNFIYIKWCPYSKLLGNPYIWKLRLCCCSYAKFARSLFSWLSRLPSRYHHRQASTVLNTLKLFI